MVSPPLPMTAPTVVRCTSSLSVVLSFTCASSPCSRFSLLLALSICRSTHGGQCAKYGVVAAFKHGDALSAARCAIVSLQYVDVAAVVLAQSFDDLAALPDDSAHVLRVDQQSQLSGVLVVVTAALPLLALLVATRDAAAACRRPCWSGWVVQCWCWLRLLSGTAARVDGFVCSLSARVCGCRLLRRRSGVASAVSWSWSRRGSRTVTARG